LAAILSAASESYFATTASNFSSWPTYGGFLLPGIIFYCKAQKKSCFSLQVGNSRRNFFALQVGNLRRKLFFSENYFSPSRLKIHEEKYLFEKK